MPDYKKAAKVAAFQVNSQGAQENLAPCTLETGLGRFGALSHAPQPTAVAQQHFQQPLQPAPSNTWGDSHVQTSPYVWAPENSDISNYSTRNDNSFYNKWPKSFPDFGQQETSIYAVGNIRNTRNEHAPFQQSPIYSGDGQKHFYQAPVYHEYPSTTSSIGPMGYLPSEPSPGFYMRHEDINAHSAPIPRTTRTRSSKTNNISSIIQSLHKHGLNPTTLLTSILESTDSSSTHFITQDTFYRPANEAHICRLLDLITVHHQGKEIFKTWLTSPSALPLVAEIVCDEMDTVKPLLRMTSAEATTEYVSDWDIEKIMEPVEAQTPFFTSILKAAMTPLPRGKKQNVEQANTSDTGSDPEPAGARNRPRARYTIAAQVHYLRSQASCKAQIGIGLTASVLGASRSLIDIMHNAGLCISYTGITNTLNALANSSQEKAAQAVKGPHAVAYDNIQTLGSTHIEQRPDAPNKVRSGTFGMIYELPNARMEDMKLEPMIERLKKAPHLKITDLRMEKEARESYNHQTRVNITKVLFKYSDDDGTKYKTLSEDPLLQHRPRRPLPENHKTTFHPLKVSTFEEASIEGNLSVHDDMYIHQLGQAPANLNFAIPSLNDRLTNARIHSTQALRAKDVNFWERRDIFMIAFGVFHLVMNFIWALLSIHRGGASKLGSLSYFFSVMEKVRLGTDRPDYYTLLAAFTQILDGLILNAWRTECMEVADGVFGIPGPPGTPGTTQRFTSLKEFLDAGPSAETIMKIATHIQLKYATVEHIPAHSFTTPRHIIWSSGPLQCIHMIWVE